MTIDVEQKIQDIKTKLNDENDGVIKGEDIVIIKDVIPQIEPPIITPFQKPKLNRNDMIECNNCKRFVRRDGYGRHLISTMCLMGNQEKKTFIEDILKDKFKNLESLFIQYCIETKSHQKKVLFKMIIKLNMFISEKIFQSYKIDDNLKETLVNELFNLNYNISKEHSRKFKDC